jgi:hypothetical protein
MPITTPPPLKHAEVARGNSVVEAVVGACDGPDGPSDRAEMVTTATRPSAMLHAVKTQRRRRFLSGLRLGVVILRVVS